MLCPNCNSTIYEGEKFCPTCGAAIANQQPQAKPLKPIYSAPVEQNNYGEVLEPQDSFTEDDLPEQYRPLSPWSYFGLSILFTIPIIGFIFLIVFSFNGSNINRRNYARSYWCALIIVGGVFLIGLLFVLLLLGTVRSVPVYRY